MLRFSRAIEEVGLHFPRFESGCLAALRDVRMACYRTKSIASLRVQPQSKKVGSTLIARSIIESQRPVNRTMKFEIDSWRRPLFDDVIRRIRVRSGEYYRPEFRAPWGVSVSRNCPVFHVVKHGNCQLEFPGRRDPILMSEGD